MSNDDIIYVSILICSIFFGFWISRFSSNQVKKLVSAVLGVVCAFIVCGYHIYHSIVVVLGNIVIIRLLGPRICHAVSFVWCFGYLAFFRTTYYFNIPNPPPHSNAIQLLLTLRLIGLAFEVHDCHQRRRKAKKEDGSLDEALQKEQKYFDINPSLIDQILYSFCYIGLLTGPYYKYRVYDDSFKRDSAKLSGVSHLLQRVLYVPLYAAVFLAVSSFFKVEDAKTDEFYEYSFWYRLFYIVPVFIIFRTRLYIAWTLSECMCMSAFFGAYPAKSKPRSGHGPTNLDCLEGSAVASIPTEEYDFETIRCVDVTKTEITPTVKEGMRYWNMSVQYWLAQYVYKRIPFGSLRVSLTMAVSAFWHGIHPGYYLSFLTVPPCMMAESALGDAFRWRLSSGKQRFFDFFIWFFRMREFEYMSMGFLLLGFETTVRYWRSVYFIGHVVCLVLFLIGIAGQMVLGRQPKRAKDDDRPKEAAIRS